MAKAPVMRLTARRTASSRGIAGWEASRVRTASAVLASDLVVVLAKCGDSSLRSG